MIPACVANAELVVPAAMIALLLIVAFLGGTVVEAVRRNRATAASLARKPGEAAP